MATMYYKISVSGPNYYTGSGPTNEYLYIGSEKITSKYDWHWDDAGSCYFTKSIVSATFVKPATYDTDTYSIDHAEQDHSDYRAWSSRWVSDDLVIPAQFSATKLPEYFQKDESGLGFGISNTNFSYSSNTIAGMNFGDFSISTSQSMIDVAIDYASRKGYGSYAAALENALTVNTALKSIVQNGLDVLDVGFQNLNNPNFSAKDYDALVDGLLSSSQATLNKALIDLKVAPGNEAAEKYIDGMLSGAQLIGNLQGGSTISGSVEVGFEVNIGDVLTLESSVTGTLSTDIVLDGAKDTTIDGKAGNDLLAGGGGNDVLFGQDGNDFLYGGIGSDRLNGGMHNDRLVGGAGKDLTTGGGGLDKMVYTALTDSGTTFATRDVINTFAHGDKIDLSAIDANTKWSGNQAFTWATAFTGTAGQLVVTKTSDTATVDGYLVTADVNSDRAADFSLMIYGSPALDKIYAWDFIM